MTLTYFLGYFSADAASQHPRQSDQERKLAQYSRPAMPPQQQDEVELWLKTCEQRPFPGY